jgi:ribosomal protein L28
MFARVSPLKYLENFARFKLKPTRKTGGGLNFHRSNKAKEGVFVRADLACVVVCYYRSGLSLLCTGLYHGKDIRSGHSISFSHKKTKRKFYPNVINKRVYSECLDQYIRFRMTTTALKAIDSYGGIDKYMLDLDEVSVTDSTHNSRVRDLIASTLFHQGKLADRHIRRLGYEKEAPITPEEILAAIYTPQHFTPTRPNTAPLTPVLKSSE